MKKIVSLSIKGFFLGGGKLSFSQKFVKCWITKSKKLGCVGIDFVEYTVHTQSIIIIQNDRGLCGITRLFSEH